MVLLSTLSGMFDDYVMMAVYYISIQFTGYVQRVDRETDVFKDGLKARMQEKKNNKPESLLKA